MGNRDNLRFHATALLLGMLCGAALLAGGALGALYLLPPKTTDRGESTVESGSLVSAELAESEGLTAESESAVTEEPEEVHLTPSELLRAATASVSVRGEADAISGSAFLISADGYLLSCWHVVGGEEGAYPDILIRLEYNGKTYPASVIAYTRDTDLALLKISPEEELPFLEPSDAPVSDGERVWCAGYPQGVAYMVMEGGILNADYTDSRGYSCMLITRILNGQSGGAVLNEYGQLIGYARARFTLREMDSIGIVYPISFSSTVLRKWEETGDSGADCTADMKFALRFTTGEEQFIRYSAYLSLAQGSEITVSLRDTAQMPLLRNAVLRDVRFTWDTGEAQSEIPFRTDDLLASGSSVIALPDYGESGEAELKIYAEWTDGNGENHSSEGSIYFSRS